MKVCLTGFGTLQPSQEELFRLISDLANKNPGPHTLVEKPADADLILLIYGCSTPEVATPDQKKLLKERPNDHYVFDTYDLANCSFQGTYVSISRRLAPNRRFRSYCQPMINNYVEDIYRGAPIEPDLLFSFMGGSTSWLRKKMYQLDYGRPDIVIRDTSYHHEWSHRTTDWEKNKIEYAKVLARSKFVVSPKGATATSSRIYEGMQMGRPIVIVSDDFLTPDGPDWKKFMIEVRERDIERLPEILAPYENNWQAMGKIARAEWENWFAPNMWFQRLVGYSQDIAKCRKVSESHHLWKVPYLRMVQKVRVNGYFTARNSLISLLKATGLAKKLHLNRA